MSEGMGKDSLFPCYSGEGLTVEFSWFPSALINQLFSLKMYYLFFFSPLGMKEEERKVEGRKRK